jgi:aldehyde dehydrogenase (NAD+)
MNIPELVSSQKLFFRTGETLELSFRLKQLQKLRDLVSDNHHLLSDAVYRDFGKPEFEVYTNEIAVLLQEIDTHVKNLSGWAKPESVKGTKLTFPSRNNIYSQPYGTVLIIGTWNYPVHLLLLPLIGAISAGNCAILKPSEQAPETSRTIAGLISDRFDSNYLACVEGDAGTSQELLKEKFNYIFFTGSTRVGKMVMQAAAEHLTPVTLELGGKSPAIIHKDAEIEIAARRIWWGKYVNAGQTCVAPDFAAVHRDVEESFIRYSEKVIGRFMADGSKQLRSYSRIINDNHFNRLTDLLSKSEPVAGGEADPKTRRISPTLVRAGWDHPLMEDEIFGPILPMIVYEDFNDLIHRLRDMPSPLALYLFTENSDIKSTVIREIPFGGGCINDTLTHLGNSNLPFGGVGASGMGSYHGKFSFDTFSYKKAILDKPVWPDLKFRYPPYSDTKLNLFKKIFS